MKRNLSDTMRYDGVRMTYKDRWLIVNGEQFTVYQRRRYAKKTIVLYSGYDEGWACKILLGGE